MKDIYELMNEVNIDDFEEMKPSELEKVRLKRNLRKSIELEKIKKREKKNKNLLKIAGIVGATIIISSFVIGANETFASKIPVIGEFFQRIYGEKNSDFLKYSEVIDKTVSKGGIDVTFHTAAISNDTMILDFTVKNNNEKITNSNMHEALLIPTKMTFNGKDVPTGAGASWKQIDDNTVRVLKNVNIGSEGNFANGEINIQIFIDELFGVKEDFGVKFKYDKSLQDKLSITKKIGKKIKYGESEAVIEKVSASPLTASIYSRTRKSNSNVGFGFVAMDDKGNLLEWQGGSGGGSLGSYSDSNTFKSNQGMESVTFIPYNSPTRGDNTFVFYNSIKSAPFNVDSKEDIVIMANEDYGIKIFDWIREGDYLVVKYKDIILGKEMYRGNLPIARLDLNKKGEGKVKEINEHGYLDDFFREIPEDIRSNLFKKYGSSEYEIESFYIGDNKELEFTYNYNKDLTFLKDEAITLDLPK